MRSAAAALLLLPAGPASALDCAPIPPPGEAGETEVSGVAPAEGSACYALPVEAGQRARFQILEGEVQFAVDGIVEGQEDYAFVAEGGTYAVRLAPLAPGVADEPFTLRVSLSPAPGGAPGDWRVEEGEGRARGLAWISEEGGASISVACGPAGSRPSMTYDGMGTAALAREDAARAAGLVEIERGGESRRHEVVLERFDGFDRYWEVVGGLDAALLDDFAEGSALRLLDAEGSVAGEVGLVGSGRLREAMARRCGL